MESTTEFPAAYRRRRPQPETTEFEANSLGKYQKPDISLHPALGVEPAVSAINSLLSFINYITTFPRDLLVDCFAFDATLGNIAGRVETRFIGQGTSFTVVAQRIQNLPTGLLEKRPPLADGQLVAVKIPRINGREEIGFDAGAEVRALKAIAWECHVLSRPKVRSCKNIVGLLGLSWRPVYTCGENNLRFLPVLLMEYAHEGALTNLWNPDLYLTTYNFKRNLALDIARGLGTLHEQGIIHGDLKCDNILLNQDSENHITAKISDFGFSVHDYGPNATARFPGRTPPWDAPEASEDHVLVKDLLRADVYSFGLLIWRLMLEGQTPFDKMAWRRSSPGFDFLNTAQSRATAILDLKRNKNDKFLALVKTTSTHFGLNQQELESIFNVTLRQDPKARVGGIEPLIRYFETGEELDDAVHLVCDSLGKRPYDPSSHIQREDGVWDIEDEVSNRITYGFGRDHIDLIQIHEMVRKHALPAVIRYQIFKDLNDLKHRNKQDLEDEFNIALCHFLGFGTAINSDLGLELLGEVAKRGHLRAQAIVKRLYLACGKQLPGDMPVSKWLFAAASSGSHIALEDLFDVDRDLYHAAAEPFRRKSCEMMPGFLGKEILEAVQRAYHISNEAACVREVQESLRSADLISMRLVEGDISSSTFGLLAYSAALGYHDTIRGLLAIGLDCNKRVGPSDATPLLVACIYGRYDAIKVLLEGGADVTIRNAYGLSPLHSLASLGDDAQLQEIARILVKKGADLHAKGFVPRSRAMNRFLAENEILSGTPLHFAVYGGRIAFVKTLLELGARPLERDMDFSWNHDFRVDDSEAARTSAIHVAASRLEIDILQTLLDYEDSSTDIDFYSLKMFCIEEPTLLQMCRHGSRYKENFAHSISMLRKGENPMNLIGSAIISEQVSVVADMIPSIPDIDSLMTRVPMTPFQLSLERQNGTLALLFLQHGANPLVRSPAVQCSPLTTLAMRPLGTHDREIIESLMARGMSFRSDRSPFQLLYRRAVYEGWTEVSSYLLSKVSCEEKEDLEMDLVPSLIYQNSSASLGPLHFLLEPQHNHEGGRASFVAHRGHQHTLFHRLLVIPEDICDNTLNHHILRYLLSKFSSSAQINAQDRYGTTAVANAVRTGKVRGVIALLENNADPFAGRLSAVILAVDRCIPGKLASVSGSFLGVLGRYRTARRYDENSIRVLWELLKWYIKGKGSEPSSANDWRTMTISDLQDILQGFASDTFRNEVMARAIQKAAIGASVTTSGKRDEPPRLVATMRKEKLFLEKVGVEGSFRPATFDEMKTGTCKRSASTGMSGLMGLGRPAIMGIWDVVVVAVMRKMAMSNQ